MIIELHAKSLLSACVAYIQNLQAKVLAESLIGLLCLAMVPACIKATQADAVLIGIFRLSVAGLLVALFFMKPAHWRSFASAKTWPPLLTIGLLFGLHWMLYFWAIKLSNASLGSIGMSTYSISVMIIGLFLRQHRPHPAEWIILILSFLGTLLVVPEFSIHNQYTLGFLLAVVSGFIYAWLPFLHQKASHLSLSLRTFSQYAFALPVFLLFHKQASWQTLELFDWKILTLLALVGTFAGHSLWVRASSRLPTEATQMLYFLYLPASVFISSQWLDEALSLTTLLGAGLVLFSSALGLILQWKQQQKRKTTQS